MTAPNIQQGPVIQDPGLGGAMAGALGQVVAALQQKREEEYRAQQLQMAQQQHAAQLAQQQAMLQIQQQQEARAQAEATQGQAMRAQVGAVQRRALGGQPPAAPMGAPAPQRQPGNMTQSQDTSGLFHQILGGGAQALAPAQGSPDIFGGVSDENVPAAVQGLQEVAALQPKEPELPTSAKEFEYLARLAKSDPQRAMLYKSLFLDKTPQTVINNIPSKGQTAFAEELGKVQAGFFKENVDKAHTALRAFPSLNEAYGLTGKSATGIAAGAELNAARILSALGVKAGKDKTENTQTMVKLLRENALSYLRSRDLGSGTAVSDGDRLFVEQLSGADISMDAGTIRKVIRINVGSDIEKVEASIKDLRDQAIAYPEDAVQLNSQASSLEKRLGQIRTRYAEMVAAEGTAASDLRNRLNKVPGMQLR